MSAMDTSRGLDDATAARERLRSLIAERSVREGDFTLASGKASNLFIDLKPIMLEAEGIALLGRLLFDRVAATPARFVGGLAMGAVPLAVSVCQRSHDTGSPLGAFWVRKEQKEHGTRKLIDGTMAPGDSVAVLEDVTTTGGSLLRAVEALRAYGCTPVAALTVVDREEGAREEIRRVAGLELDALYRRADFTDLPAI
jgi:orotate phosphoribosyltransferase